MKYLSFTLSGDFAMFKKPFTSQNVSNELQFSYDHITPVALKGLVGAILGYSGLAKATREKTSIEFLDKLSGVKIGILPEQTVFEKRNQKIVNTTGFANKGSNNIIEQEILTDVSWTIVIEEFSDFDKLVTMLEKNQTTFPITLGKKGFMAKFSNVVVFEQEPLTNESVDSLVPVKYLIETKKNPMEQFVESEQEYQANFPIDYNENFEYINELLGMSSKKYKGCSIILDTKKIGLF